jgi:hypothetical protein
MLEPSGVRRALAVAGVLGCLVLPGCAPTSAAPTASHAASPSPRPDWRNATYRVTCDGLLADSVSARLVDGAATVPLDVSESPSYDSVNLRLEATATGDLDGAGSSDTVVLLQCWPQPSNGFVEEVHVFRSDGSQLAVLPSPSSLPETTILAPLYVPSGLTVQNGDIVAAMKSYGPDDSHATGPSVPFTVRWHWTGRGFAPEP